ncbi:MAG TPA: hypothetical protein VFI31_23025 [Pirellulales bacterium]|nr:hypothetical protein [Pirellulales bacterium]
MLGYLAMLFRRTKPRVANFDGEQPCVDVAGPHYARLLAELAQDHDLADAKSILRIIERRMDDAVKLANNRTHESLMQAHKEAVENETLLLAWANKYRPQAPPEKERRRLTELLQAILGFVAVIRLSFEGSSDEGPPRAEGGQVYVPLQRGMRSGPFCRSCYDREGRLYLLAHSSDPKVHMKCPGCELV